MTTIHKSCPSRTDRRRDRQTTYDSNTNIQNADTIYNIDPMDIADVSRYIDFLTHPYYVSCKWTSWLLLNILRRVNVLLLTLLNYSIKYRVFNTVVHWLTLPLICNILQFHMVWLIMITLYNLFGYDQSLMRLLAEPVKTGTDKMRPPACGASSMIRAGLGLGIASWIWLGSWWVSEEGFGLVRVG